MTVPRVFFTEILITTQFIFLVQRRGKNWHCWTILISKVGGVWKGVCTKGHTRNICPWHYRVLFAKTRRNSYLQQMINHVHLWIMHIQFEENHISISSSQSDIGDALFSVPVITNRNLYYLIKTNFRILCVTWSHDLPVISPKSSLARILENLLFSKKQLYSSPLQSWIYIVKFNFIRLATRGENIDVHVLY